MKTILLVVALCFPISYGFAQNNVSKGAPVINVPDFADQAIKKFYQSYAKHLVKCIGAIREKNEAKATSLFKDPGERLVAREKLIAKELVKNAVEKQKYIGFASQVYPYIKEVEGSAFFKKMYGK